jgi:uncharacterized SAM-binding protein YcdF (DUF218 family)
MNMSRTTHRAVPARSRRSAGHGRRRIVIALLVVLVGFGAATARLFVWPAQGMPARVDAIVMLNGPGGRLQTAEMLAWAHRAPMLVVSRGSSYWGHGSVCAPKIPRVKVICFDPTPNNTRGEAEFAGTLAKRYRWQSVVVVTTTPQDTRARLRVGRCLSGPIYVVNAPLPASSWPAAVVYEWGATIKALVLQRSC